MPGKLLSQPSSHPRASGGPTYRDLAKPAPRSNQPRRCIPIIDRLIYGLLALLLIAPTTWANDETAAPAFDYARELAASQDAIGKIVGNHRFVDGDGQPFEFDRLHGKPLVVSMIYTSCYHICPMTTQHLASVVDKAKETLGEDSFNVALIGFDTAVDNPQAMRHFAARQGVAGKGWYLLSGDAKTVAALSRDLGFKFFPTSNGFDHLIQASVIDAEGKVYRQVYGQVFETPLLVDPLIELVFGRPAPRQTFFEGLVQKVKLFCTTYDPVRDGYFIDYSLFLGILIGAVIIVATATFVARELRRH